MALAQVKAFTQGSFLDSTDLNGLETNILNNPVALITQAAATKVGQVPVGITTTAFASGNIARSGVRGLVGAIPGAGQTGAFSAHQYVFQTTDGTGSWCVASTPTFTVNLGVAGPAANARDQAGVFSTSFVHWYAISTGPGSTGVVGTVSTMAPPTGPTLPTSYKGWTYLAASVYSTLTTQIVASHNIRDNKAIYLDIQSIATHNSTVTSTVLDFPKRVPPTAPTILTQLAGVMACATSGSGQVKYYLRDELLVAPVSFTVSGAPESTNYDTLSPEVYYHSTAEYTTLVEPSASSSFVTRQDIQVSVTGYTNAI